MKHLQSGGQKGNRSERDRGVTLIETMIAVFVALIGVFSLGTLIFQATVTNKNQGTEVTRATIYAQDKTEKLLSLNFAACTLSPSSQPAACNSTGITASGWTRGLLEGGVLSPMPPSCPASGSSVGYVDFLDINGNQYAGTSCSAVPSATIAYVRMWQITDLASTGGPAIKQVTVAVFSKAAVSTTGAASTKPVVLLTSLISNPN